MAAEQAVLGAVMLDGRAFYDLPPRLKTSDFWFNNHRTVFDAFTELAAAKTPIDSLTVQTHLIERGKIGSAGGSGYVTSLTNVVPSIANLGSYAQIVMDQSEGRKLRWRLDEASKIAGDERLPILDRKARVDQILAMDDADDEPIEDEREVLKRVLRRLEQAENGQSSVRGMKFGIDSLDATLFVNPTDLVVIGGRPKNGKSVLASMAADHVGSTMGPVLFIPLEMRADEVVARRIMDRGSITIEDLRNPRTNNAEKKIIDTIDEIYKQTRVRYFRCRELNTILRAATRMKRREGLKMLVVDYLQRLNIWGLPGDNRDQQLGYVTDKLKSWADDNECTVLLLSQLSRPMKNPRRPGSKPMRAPHPTEADLRESGNIEADANAIILMHIPGLIDGTPEAAAKDKRTTACIVAKQRSGESNIVVPLNAVFEHARFSEPPPEPEEPTQAELEAEKRDKKAKGAKQQRMDLPAEEKPDEDDGRDH